jgi:hypothetical protein
LDASRPKKPRWRSQTHRISGDRISGDGSDIIRKSREISGVEISGIRIAGLQLQRREEISGKEKRSSLQGKDVTTFNLRGDL